MNKIITNATIFTGDEITTGRNIHIQNGEIIVKAKTFLWEFSHRYFTSFFNL